MSTDEQIARTWNFYLWAMDGERPRLGFAPHALERGVEMAEQSGLDPAEIRGAMLAPESVGWSNKYSSCLLTKGRCTLSIWVSEDDTPFVQTILWGTQEAWDQSYTAPTDGRTRRPAMPFLPSTSN